MKKRAKKRFAVMAPVMKHRKILRSFFCFAALLPVGIGMVISPSGTLRSEKNLRSPFPVFHRRGNIIIAAVLAIIITGIIIFASQNNPVPAPLTAEERGRPLVGVINYEGTRGLSRLPDEVSLTPPQWNHRLPFYSSITKDESRLVRSENTVQQITYRHDNIVGLLLYAAYKDTEPMDITGDIKVHYSTNGKDFTQYVYNNSDTRKINQAVNWQKVSYQVLLPQAVKFIKIEIAKQDGNADSVQLMYAEIYYTKLFKKNLYKIAEDFNDFTHMSGHSAGLSFAKDNGGNFTLVLADNNAQEKMDRQIAYAKSAHIDYFAYLDASSNETSVADLFRSSKNRGGIGYCVIVHQTQNDNWAARIRKYVKYFKDSDYMKVLDNRPLIYIFTPECCTKADIDLLRLKSQEAGCGNPYVVGMTFSNEDYSSFCDAGSCYLSQEPGVTQQYAGTAYTVPLVCFGANEGPRVDNPVPWGNGSAASPELWGEELKPYIREGLQWCAENKNTAAPAQTILINAWNEHCESAACIEPTRKADGTANTVNLDALGTVLKEWENMAGANSIK